jgi:hypothetical protein
VRAMAASANVTVPPRQLANADMSWIITAIGFHVLKRDGKLVGRIWGWRCSAPWTAEAGGRTLGTYPMLEEARLAVEQATSQLDRVPPASSLDA